jgi:hypothetical protein
VRIKRGEKQNKISLKVEVFFVYFVLFFSFSYAFASFLYNDIAYMFSTQCQISGAAIQSTARQRQEGESSIRRE